MSNETLGIRHQARGFFPFLVVIRRSNPSLIDLGVFQVLVPQGNENQKLLDVWLSSYIKGPECGWRVLTTKRLQPLCYFRNVCDV